MSFRIIGLPAEAFQHLFALSDEELAAHNAVRRIADDRSPGYPCRVSLTDSKPGDELILVNYGTSRRARDGGYRITPTVTSAGPGAGPDPAIQERTSARTQIGDGRRVANHIRCMGYSDGAHPPVAIACLG